MSITLVKSTREGSVVCNWLLPLVEDYQANQNSIAMAKYEAQKKKLPDQ
jgi:hypothetical protein